MPKFVITFSSDEYHSEWIKFSDINKEIIEHQEDLNSQIVASVWKMLIKKLFFMGLIHISFNLAINLLR